MRTLLLPETMVRLSTAPGTPAIGAVLIAVLVLGLGSGCVSPMTGDPTPGMLRVVSGADASRWYVRATAASLPVTRGVPCPMSSWNLEGTLAANTPRPAVAPADSTALAISVRSISGERG